MGRARENGNEKSDGVETERGSRRVEGSLASGINQF